MLVRSLGLVFLLTVPAVARLRGQTGDHVALALNETNERSIDPDTIQEGKLCIAKIVGGEDILVDEKMPQEYARGSRAMATKSVIMAGLVRQARWTINRLFRAPLRHLRQRAGL